MNRGITSSRFPILVGAVCLAAELTSAGCTTSLARRFVGAPNSGKTVAMLDASPTPSFDFDHSDPRWRVAVGPPNASLSVLVFEPMQVRFLVSHGPEERFYISWRGWPDRPPRRSNNGQPIGTIVMLHGWEQTKEPLMLLAGYFANEGYRVVLVDLRGHGRSTGDLLTYGAIEKKDLRQVADALEVKGLSAPPIIAMGLSYGGSVALQWAAVDPRVRVVVAIETFSTLDRAAKDFIPPQLGWRRWLISEKALERAVRQAGRLAGFDPNQVSPLTVIQTIDVPVLLVHGEKDRLIPSEHSRLLAAARPENTDVVLVPGVGHIELYLRAVELAAPQIEQWLEGHFIDDSTVDGPIESDVAEN